MTFRLWLLGCLLTGCAAPATTLSPATRHVRPRCSLVASQLYCGHERVALGELGVGPVRAAAPRAGGGLWLLGEAGELVRVDRHGARTGITATDFVALQQVGGLVCALDAAGKVSCLPDHAGDARCGERAPVAAPVRLSLSFRSFAAGAPGLLCGLDEAGTRRCAAIARSCDRACLQFPDCDQPLRCIDPCEDGEAPLQFVQQPGSLG